MAKIVHLANFYGPKSGGLKTMMLNVAAGAHRLGHEVHHIVPGLFDQTSITEHYTQHTVKSHAIPRSGGYRVITRTAHVIEILKDIKPDVIELSDRATLLSVADWARSQGIPTVMFAHERIDGVIDSHFKLTPSVMIADTLNRNAAKRVDKIVATTDFAAEEFRRIGVTTHLIPLGVDLKTFSPSLRTPHTYDEIVVGLCSRLSAEKRSDFVLEIAQAAQSSGFNVRFQIAGDGPLALGLRKQAIGLPVEFLGFISDRSEVAKFLASCDVILAPGPIETFGLAALEALACGTPVIANSSSAVPEVLGSAGASAPLDAQLWLDQILRLTEFGTDPNCAARLIARARAQEFPWERTVAKILELHSLESRSLADVG